MKKSFMLYIIACMSSFFLFVSCEKSELQTTPKADTTIPVTTRSAIEDCEDCPLDYCCCAIELLETGTYDLLLCGVYTAMPGTPCGPFTPSAPCGTISGISSPMTLVGIGDRELFCVPSGGSFRLVYTNSGIASVRITCKYNETNPDWEELDLVSTVPEYLDTYGNCLLQGGCD